MRQHFGAEKTQQEKLTILIEGLFIEIAKKAFIPLQIVCVPGTPQSARAAIINTWLPAGLDSRRPAAATRETARDAARVSVLSWACVAVMHHGLRRMMW
jgi:hypothetical protein